MIHRSQFSDTYFVRYWNITSVLEMAVWSGAYCGSGFNCYHTAKPGHTGTPCAGEGRGEVGTNVIPNTCKLCHFSSTRETPFSLASRLYLASAGTSTTVRALGHLNVSALRVPSGKLSSYSEPLKDVSSIILEATWSLVALHRRGSNCITNSLSRTESDNSSSTTKYPRGQVGLTALRQFPIEQPPKSIKWGENEV